MGHSNSKRAPSAEADDDFVNICNYSKLSEKQIVAQIQQHNDGHPGTSILLVSKFQNKIREEAVVLGDPFIVDRDGDSHGRRMRIRLQFQAGELYAHVEETVAPSDEDDEQPASTNSLRITFLILDQSDRGEKRHVTRIIEPTFGSSARDTMRTDVRLLNFTKLLGLSRRGVYIKRDAVLVMVLVEATERPDWNSISSNGVLVWTVGNYAATKLDAGENVVRTVHSQYFYSGHGGYRLQARLKWVFWGQVTTFECWIVVLAGEFDAQLPPVFSHRCTYSVLSPRLKNGLDELVLGTSELNQAVLGLEKAADRMSDDYSFAWTVNSDLIENDSFLIDDKLILKVVVEPLSTAEQIQKK